VQSNVVRHRARRLVQEGGAIDVSSEPIGAISWRNPDDPPDTSAKRRRRD
jgi:hypothetical protein